MNLKCYSHSTVSFHFVLVVSFFFHFDCLAGFVLDDIVLFRFVFFFCVLSLYKIHAEISNQNHNIMNNEMFSINFISHFLP